MPARAAGWVVELQSRADGIWARVDWTKDGQALLSEKSSSRASRVCPVGSKPARSDRIPRMMTRWRCCGIPCGVAASCGLSGGQTGRFWAAGPAAGCRAWRG
jgi:hypothetical protein